MFDYRSSLLLTVKKKKIYFSNCVNRIHLAWDRVQEQVFVNMVMDREFLPWLNNVESMVMWSSVELLHEGNRQCGVQMWFCLVPNYYPGIQAFLIVFLLLVVPSCFIYVHLAVKCMCMLY